MMMYGRGLGWGMMGGGWLWFLLFGMLIVAGIVVLVIWAVRAASGHGRSETTAPPERHDEAIAIAKRRLASGEITLEQYQEIVRTLSG